MAKRVELAQVIGQLRRELTVAMREGEGEDLRFELGPVQLELTVAVSREAGPNAKVRFWVIELGAEATVSSQATQQITLTLDPRHRGVAGKPLIAGPEQAGER
ncbi:MAG: trypco2 family protein [Pseudonocardiaceae bacterium]